MNIDKNAFLALAASLAAIACGEGTAESEASQTGEINTGRAAFCSPIMEAQSEDELGSRICKEDVLSLGSVSCVLDKGHGVLRATVDSEANVSELMIIDRAARDVSGLRVGAVSFLRDAFKIEAFNDRPSQVYTMETTLQPDGLFRGVVTIRTSKGVSEPLAVSCVVDFPRSSE